MYRPQLKTFLTVCETGSFSKAAEQLFITPSAVLQQIRTLEAELDAALFVRSSKGVSLTSAGDYLYSHGTALVQMGDKICRDIRAMTEGEKRICVGTSLMEKVRVLYDLWVLFSEEVENCEIQMLNIDVAHNIPAATDLIESINSSVPWMREWDFFEICQVPFGFAFPNGHPLASRSRIRLEDLKGETVLTLEDGSCETITRLVDLLRRHGVTVTCPGSTSGNPLWESAFRRNALLVPTCWSDILINMTVVPFEQRFTLPYGIFSRPEPQPEVRRFLDFVALTYREGNARGIVPVLG